MLMIRNRYLNWQKYQFIWGPCLAAHVEIKWEEQYRAESAVSNAFVNDPSSLPRVLITG
jgi:hypothetical protein